MIRSEVSEANAGGGVEVEKIRKKDVRIGCEQVDGGVVQRLASYLFTALEVCLLTCVCARAHVRAVITSSTTVARADLSSCMTVASV